MQKAALIETIHILQTPDICQQQKVKLTTINKSVFKHLLVRHQIFHWVSEQGQATQRLNLYCILDLNMCKCNVYLLFSVMTLKSRSKATHPCEEACY